ncbi:hypothetical protein CYK16_06635 [Streptococcus oralis subsp. dentisani]|jgi:uncharacterized protein HI_1406|uniref:DUF2513 domain-containing protein n=2 Tax=Streptococcus oralis TaxID=1303 RepID=A0A2I1UE56_STROR|nr:DUF2513 domain-containing protein [Streptococcus mitis]PLA04148.1 hypothetical protein CYK16_06635 [Streptococcus oralis subsp. dentisani]
MDLCRLILFKIEDEYKSTALSNLQIDGYDIEIIAYHCDLLFEAGLIKSYKPTYASDKIYFFSVGALTWEGHDFLDKIRENTMWNRTKNRIKENALPMTLEVIKTIATSLINDQLSVYLNDSLSL